MRTPVTDRKARALASWSCVLWGWQKGAQVGAPCASVRVDCVWAHSLCQPPVLGAYGRGPLPTDCRCGSRAWGPALPTAWPCWRCIPIGRRKCVPGSTPRLVGSFFFPRAVARCVLCELPGFAFFPWALLLGTCPCAFVMAGGVPLWRASWPRVGSPRLVQSGCCGAFPY